VSVSIENEFGTGTFLALWRKWIAIPVTLFGRLRLRHGEELDVVEFHTVKDVKRPRMLLANRQIDVLSFVPRKAVGGFAYAVDKYRNAGGEGWIRLWYCHKRGAARQVELRRYVEAGKFGRLLGQYQAEGDKGNPDRIAFTSVLVSEHADFISYLNELGLSSDSVRGACVFDPSKIDESSVGKLLAYYSDRTGIAACDTRPQSMKGAFAFVTFVRSKILKAIIDNALEGVRRKLTRPGDRSAPSNELLENFVAKLLTGDGTFDVQLRDGRVSTKIKLVDQCASFRRDYSVLLARLGFRPKINNKRIDVASYCTFENLLTLFRINAFSGTRNWPKLICAIELSLRGPTNAGYERVRRLSSSGQFSSLDVSKMCGKGRRAANLWLQTMMKRELIMRLGKFRGHEYIPYSLTMSGLFKSRLLAAIHAEYQALSERLGEVDPLKLLSRIKSKHSYHEGEILPGILL